MKKYPEHDSHSSSTQDSTYKGDGSPGKPYRSGENVHKGGSGSKSSGKQAPAAQPKKGPY